MSVSCTHMCARLCKRSFIEHKFKKQDTHEPTTTHPLIAGGTGCPGGLRRLNEKASTLSINGTAQDALLPEFGGGGDNSSSDFGPAAAGYAAEPPST